MKHKILLFVLASLMVALNGEAQDFWETLPFPDGTNIYCIAINNEGDIFVGTVYDYGLPGGVYRSLDNGQSWDLVLNLGTFGVLSLDINAEGRIYAGTNDPYSVYSSSNNGLNWNGLSVPQRFNVLDIQCFGTDTVFVSQWDNSGGLVIRSPDCGQTWETVFTTQNGSEYVSDIEITDEGSIYLSLEGFYSGEGGVYKSENNGVTWEFIGLFDCMVTSLVINNAGDLFAGSWGGSSIYNASIYVLRNGHQDWDTLTYEQMITDMVINTEGHIYCSSSWPYGVVRSLDNGASFQPITEGLTQGDIGDLAIDNLGYIYITTYYGSNFLAKSVGPTVTIFEHQIKKGGERILLYPNPCKANLYVEIESTVCTGTALIKIYNCNGMLVHKQEVKYFDNVMQFETAGFKPGIYQIVVMVNNEYFSSTFVKS